MTLKLITMCLQAVIALGLLNVWLVRSKIKTSYRGGHSITLKDEFITYGLPIWFYYLIGFLKVSSSLLLLIGLWIPSLIFPTAFVVSILMLGALLMHIKCHDPFKKMIPASLMLILSVALCICSWLL